MPAPIVHFEIGCKDMPKIQKFYADLFGWSFQNFGGANMVTNIGPSHDGGKPKTDGIGGHLNSLGHPPHQYVTVYAQVDDIEATLAKITKLGGTTLVPKQEVPSMGWFAWFKDPEGNALGLWKSMMPG
jgi:uncharacterized protein